MLQAKILLVDDTPANLIALKSMLKNTDAKLIEANSGELALEQCQVHDNIALILLDVQLPGLDGFKVAELLQLDEKTRSIPIIFITANQEDALYEKAYLSGGVDFIQKPFRKLILLAKVRIFLDLWELRFGLEQEIDNRKNAERHIERMARMDPLTDLPNRRGLYDELKRLIHRSERYHFSSAVIYIDLDGFKTVNDRYGHDIGDKLLIQVSKNFQSIVRKTDTVARIGGDEFVVLINDIDGTASLINKIKQLITGASEDILFEGRSASVSASIGIALYPEHGQSAENLLHYADQAMYQAKNEGKNTFRFFTEKINKKAHRQVQLQDSLRSAIADDEFTVYFQPIVDVHTGLPVSAEALLRWESKKLGQVFPDEFIPAAENAGLIPEIGCWVLRKAMETGAEWKKHYDINLRLAINASTIQFRNNLLYETIKQELEAHNWPPDLLEIEITEGLLLDDSSDVSRYINRISDCGVRLSVDDFGTGFSALSYLKNYPVNSVKIDRSFIMDLPDDKESKVLVQAIVAMSHGLGLEVIAEGVETLEQWQFLQKLGCNLAQGYFFGKPMPSVDFEAYLLKQAGVRSASANAG
ncbi:MAG: diguanylate cyclase (GGDEF)-like protein [Gammaproteobacteria bacterium]|jgi:diguanylate cyclase (GGDEF)-like protein